MQTRDEIRNVWRLLALYAAARAWRAYASPLNDSPGALRRDSPTSKTRVTQVDGKRWGELRVFPSDDAQTPSRRRSNADADGFDEVRGLSVVLNVSNFKYHVDGVNATRCHRDAVDVAVRASTRLVNVQTAQVGDTPPVREGTLKNCTVWFLDGSHLTVGVARHDRCSDVIGAVASRLGIGPRASGALALYAGRGDASRGRSRLERRVPPHAAMLPLCDQQRVALVLASAVHHTST